MDRDTIKKKWDYFKYIAWPIFYWKWLGIGLLDDMYSYWFLNIAKKPHYWQDAESESCPRKYCRYCGKGKKHEQR